MFPGGGFIPILIYSIPATGSLELDSLTTETGNNLLTESGLDLLIEF